MLFEHVNYRTFLRAQLVERAAHNPQYSLRAMALQLGLAPSKLSEVLKGKRNLSVDRASVIATKLGLSTREAEYFCLLVQMESAKDPLLKESLQDRIGNLNPNHKVTNLGVDMFRMIADWYHTAILYLAEIDSFEFSAGEIAKRLGITVFEAESAIERLERLELLSREKKGAGAKPRIF